MDEMDGLRRSSRKMCRTNAHYALIVGEMAERLGRRWIGIELSAEYVALARRRTAQAGLPFKRLGREAALYSAGPWAAAR
jgi:hypothetical protein